MNPARLTRSGVAAPNPVRGLTKSFTEPTKEFEVYRLLRDSRSPRDVAATTGISGTMVYRYAARLVKWGALQVVPGARPSVYEAGPKARHYETMHANGDRRGGRGPVGIRSHDWRFTFAHAGAPATEPIWEKSWVASGVFNGRASIGVNGRQWRVEDRRGMNERSLNLMLVDDEWEFEPSKVVLLVKRLKREAARAARAFAKLHGYSLVGEVRFAGEPHYALCVAPSVEREGISGVTPDWVDGSARAGASGREYESTDAGRMARALQVAQRLDEMERRAERAEAIARRALSQVRRPSVRPVVRRWRNN